MSDGADDRQQDEEVNRGRGDVEHRESKDPGDSEQDCECDEHGDLDGMGWDRQRRSSVGEVLSEDRATPTPRPFAGLDAREEGSARNARQVQ